jgi:TPP-dependent trihydroxycyclohexane-1,2-dione (THcHDO) dehydratase
VQDLRSSGLPSNAPIVAAFDGKGIFDDSHPYYLGVLGVFGNTAVAGNREIVVACSSTPSIGISKRPNGHTITAPPTN